MARRRSRGEAEIEAALGSFDPSSERYQVLAAARDFKASWVELGEQLTSVRERNAWQDWGFPSFEAYCRRELRLKSETANKLTRSFAFVRDHEPEALSERSTRELPPLDVVDLLSQARERSNISEQQLSSIRSEVFDPEATPTRTQVVRKLREIDPEAFKSPERKARAAGDGDLRKALLLSERLLSLMEALPDVSKKSIQGVQTAVVELREQFESTRVEEAQESA